ncbi:AtpZ/AtpI family protein [Sphingomonas sp. MMS24-J45]|uniref:AtpZ/AtpI family protein n=1 Tax=Sphingomonas sp. MMS24-J45 TaxID=3238806 RepID=UPI00384C489B
MADDRAIDDLDARIASAKAAGQSRGGVQMPQAKGYGQGSKVLALLLGALFGGGVMGWALDQWLGTSPWALLIVLTLAIIGAFLNIMKISKERAE